MQDIGVMGMAVMGRNLAVNINKNGYSVSVYNITRKETDEVVSQFSENGVIGTYNLEDFIKSLRKPRKIILMIKAGEPVDQVIDEIHPLLDKGDILIDGGNSNFRDTDRRYDYLKSMGIHYIGMGVSGGELGALNGPSIMPGGDKVAYSQVSTILEKISAKTENGTACVNYIGPKGSGHYVKMVHNGIEYGIMQVISESYYLMKKILNMSNSSMAETFKEWNKGALRSYLISITGNVLSAKDKITGKDMIDVILNKASYKGTGNWMVEEAMNVGAPISLITSAVFSRFISDKNYTLDLKKTLSNVEVDGDFLKEIEQSLYLAEIVSYAQGFNQMSKASISYNWNLQLNKIAQVFESGCIIQADVLKDIENAYESVSNIENILLDPYFTSKVNECIPSLRKVVSISVQKGVPVPGFMDTLSYIDSLAKLDLPANMIQAQRDYFGAHTYERVDKEGTFHNSWYKEI